MTETIETIPRCDTCEREEGDQEWCGTCGCCVVHCKRFMDCPDRPSLCCGPLHQPHDEQGTELDHWFLYGGRLLWVPPEGHDTTPDVLKAQAWRLVDAAELLAFRALCLQDRQ